MVQHAPSIWTRGQCQCLGAMGSTGGLAIFWDLQKISPLGWVSSRSTLSMVASALESGEVIMITNVYAPVDFVGKEELWRHIQYFRNCHSFHTWVLVGDFNSVLSLEEKQGGLARLGPSSALLCQHIALFHLSYVKPSNGLYTWNHRRTGANAISEVWLDFLFLVSGLVTPSLSLQKFWTGAV